MEYRQVTIFNDAIFEVPKHIVRLDIFSASDAKHGWQVRYGKPYILFPDPAPNGSGADQSLEDAKEELLRRIALQALPTVARKV